MGIIETVTALQNAKKALVRPVPYSSEERRQQALGFLQALKSSILPFQTELAQEQGFSLEAWNSYELEGPWVRAEEILQNSAAEASGGGAQFPSGLLVLLVPRVLSLSTLVDRLIPALAAGNSVLVKMSHRTPRLNQVVRDLLAKGGFSQVGLSEDSRRDLGDLLVSHPLVAGYSLVGRWETGQELWKSSGFGKKIQMFLGGFTTNLILSEDGLKAAIADWQKQRAQGLWRTPLYPQRWIVLDSIEKQAVDSLEAATREDQVSDEVRQFLDQVVREEGTVRGSWALHLPLCSELHQSELRLPTFSLNSVKYPLDSMKWLHHSPSRYLVQVWGPEEKARAVKQRLEVGALLLNRSWDPRWSPLFGARASVAGLPDLRPLGDFFSESRRDPL